MKDPKNKQVYDGKDASEVLGRTHIASQIDWPPPKNVNEHLEFFAEFLNSNLANGTILDIGCGDGAIDRILAQRNPKKIITATDLEPHPLWKVKSPKNLKFKAVSLYDLPYAEKSFDYVMLKDVLHHLPEPEEILPKIAKIAKKQVIIIEANRYNPVSYVRMVKIAKHEHFSRRKLKRIIAKPVKIHSYETHVWPNAIKFPGKIIDSFFKLPPLKWLRNYNIAVFKP